MSFFFCSCSALFFSAVDFAVLMAGFPIFLFVLGCCIDFIMEVSGNGIS